MAAMMVGPTGDKHIQFAVHLGKLRAQCFLADVQTIDSLFTPVEPRVQFLLPATQCRNVVPQQAYIPRQRIEPGTWLRGAAVLCTTSPTM